MGCIYSKTKKAAVAQDINTTKESLNQTHSSVSYHLLRKKISTQSELKTIHEVRSCLEVSYSIDHAD